MEVHLHPDVQAQLDQLAATTGRAQSALVEDAIQGYVDELAQTRATLDRRYDDMKAGRVMPIGGDDALARLKAKTRRSASPPLHDGRVRRNPHAMATLLRERS